MDEEIKRLYEEGKNREQISKITGVSDRRIKAKLKELGLRKRAPSATPDLIESVRKLTNGDEPLYKEEIANKLGITVFQIARIIADNPECKYSKENRSKLRARDRAKQIVATTPEQTAEIVKLRTLGKKKENIAKELDVNLNKVLVKIRESGVRLTTEQRALNRDRKYTEKQYDEVKRLRKEEKITNSEIERLTGVSKGSVRAICGESGIVLTKQERFQNSRKALFLNYPNFTGNPSFFFPKGKGSESQQQKELRIVCEWILGVGEVEKANWEQLDFKCELDIWIPSQRKAIEFDGYFHDRPESIVRDAKKKALCLEKGIDLMNVYYKDYKTVAQKKATWNKIYNWLKN